MADFCGVGRTIKAECTIKMGGIDIKTPYIIGAFINKTRGNLTTTAQGSFRIPDGKKFQAVGTNIYVYFWNTLVFTGTVKRIDVSPSFQCAGELIVRFQAEDFMNRIEGRAITRRQKHSGLGPMAFIAGHTPRTTVGFDSIRNLHDISHTASPVNIFTHTVNMAEMTQFIKGGEQNTLGSLHPLTKVADILANGGKALAGGGSFILHDHSSLSLTGPHAGGPAVATYSIK